MDKHTPVQFKYGSKEKFDSITHDANTIYFISDDTTHTNRIYVGDDCFNVEVISELDDSLSSESVPNVHAVKTALNTKVNKCKIIDNTETDLPSVVELVSDTEMRFLHLDLSEDSKLNISITKPLSEIAFFYCSVTLCKVNSQSIISDFITIDTNSVIKNIHILNNDVSLVDNNVVELLFFHNGLSICCIASAYFDGTLT